MSSGTGAVGVGVERVGVERVVLVLLFLALLHLVLLHLGVASPVWAANKKAAELAENSVQADLDAVRLAHETDVLATALRVARAESKALNEGRALAQPLTPLGDEQRPLLEPLESSLQQIIDGLNAQQPVGSEETRRMTSQLIALRTKIFAKRVELSASQASLEDSLESQLADGIREAYWTSGSLSMLLFLAVISWFWQPSRSAVRRGRWRYVLGLFLVLGGLAVAAVIPYKSAAETHRNLAMQTLQNQEEHQQFLKTAAEDVVAKQLENQRQGDKLEGEQAAAIADIEAWKKAWTADSGSWVAATGEQWLKVRAVLEPVHLDAALQDALKPAIQSANDEWTRVSPLTPPTLERSSSSRWLAIIHAGGWLALIGTALWIPSRRRKKCLRCGTRGQLVPHTINQGVFKKCEAKVEAPPVEDGPSADKVDCNFEIDEPFIHSPQFYFSVVGEVSAGKTIWLAAFHYTLEAGDLDLGPDIRLSLETPGYAALKEILDIIENQGPTFVPNSPKDLPMPYLVQVEDHDWFREGTATVGVCDFSGEDMKVSYTDPRKQRMLRSHGVIAVLDPVPREDDPDLKENQNIGLGRFAAELKMLNRHTNISWLRPIMNLIGRVLDRFWCPPVAVCVSKIETLQDELTDKAVEEFLDRIHELDGLYSNEAGVVAGRRLIEARHKATRKLLRKINPGAIKAVKRISNRYKFFPMTSFGFNRQPGRGKLQPEMHLEAFFWLLHMRGYSPFAKPKDESPQ